MSPQPQPQSLPGSPPLLPEITNNQPQIQSHPLPRPLSPVDPDHPDAPLPIDQPYRDDPDQRPDYLVRYEPRPIDDEDEDGEGVGAEMARPRKAWRARLRVFWLRNMGMFLVLLAQMFGASMNVMTQILEIHSSMHPFQVCVCVCPARLEICPRLIYFSFDLGAPR
jgi:hypothetical protein